MFPQDDLFAWDAFCQEIKRLADDGRGSRYATALGKISEDAGSRDELIRFVRQLVL